MGILSALFGKKDPDELYSQGQQHLLHGNPQQAVTVLSKALANGLSGYKICEAHMLLGSAYIRLGDRASALEQLRKAEAINDERTGALRKALKQQGWL